MKYLVKTPRIIKKMYPNYLWKVDTKNKEIYLTFDDGPTPIVTQFVLDTLKEHQIKATFFCVGKNIIKNKKLFNSIITDGHAIGNHTFNHLNGWKTKTEYYLKNVSKAQEIIKKNGLHVNDNNKKLFRPPYGRIKSTQAKELMKQNYKIVMWSVLSGDFDINLSPLKCYKNVIKNTSSGQIIVLHDSKKAFDKLKYILPKLILYYQNLGFQFKSL